MKKFLAMALAFVMVLSIMPMSVLAAVSYDEVAAGCDFYNVVEKNDYALAPGAVESEIILNDDTGANRNVLHVIEVDLTNPNISVMPTYYGLNENSNFEDSSQWGVQVLTSQAAHVENDLGLNVVGGVNTNLRYDSNHPYGVLVWNGVVYSDERNAAGISTAQTFLSVTKEGVASLHSASEPIPEDAWNAISANFGWIIKNGVNQYATDDHADAGRAPRTVIGIKENGNLVLLMNDGRQAPYSAGSTMRELAEWLLAMGCVNAVNCDGGGSSTFITEREGTGELTMKSSPSDGGQRATLGGLLVVSKAVADGKFDHATVKATESYVTPGSSVPFVATGADSAGGPADIPADVTWQLADPAMGTVENGLFVSNGTLGTAIIQMVYNDNVVGEDSVEVVIPETISFAQENITVPFNKTATIEMKATVNSGLNTVTLKKGDINFELSNSALGTVSGFEYTACGEEAGVSYGTITATLAYDTTKTATANLQLGKGSEIVWDFEDGNIDSLTFGTGYSNKHPAHPELGRFESGYIEVVDATSGMVKNGDKALAVVCDYSNFYAMGYNMLKLSGLDVDMTDAVGVGFWIYLTPEATGLELDLNNAIPFDHGTAGSGDHAEEGWYYVYASKDSGVGENFNNLYFYHTDGYDLAVSQNIPNIKTKFTVFIDDITVDYSTVVEDREAPKYKHVSILKDADTYEEMNGQTVNTNTITIMAEVAEDTTKNNYTGLNTDSLQVYVDGVQLTSGATCASNGSISIDNLPLSEGIHTIRLEIADNAGNYRGITRQIVIDSSTEEAAVQLVPADPTLNNLPIGSIYYMNLQVQNMETIQSVTTVLNLDGSNDWVLDQLQVAQGFTADYTVDEYHNNATITITRTGDVKASGQGVLAVIPIHVWEYTLHIDYPDCISDGKGVCNFISTPAAMWSGDGHFRIAICLSTIQGVVEYINSTTDTFSSPEYVVDTEMNQHRNLVTQTKKDAKMGWHQHSAAAIEDKAASCTENGYTGRTVCVGCICGNTSEDPCDTFEGCGSVVDWGTTIPATGHTYVVKDGKMVCEGCGEISFPNGLVEVDGKTYCFQNGTAVSGWQLVESDWYYFEPETLMGAHGDVTMFNGNITYNFVNGKLTSGVWAKTLFGTRYYYGPDYYNDRGSWRTIDGKDYFFENGVRVEGGYQLVFENQINRNWYYFNEDGTCDKSVKMPDGFYTDRNGYAYSKDGQGLSGLQVIDGKTYYFDSKGYAQKNGTYANHIFKDDFAAYTGLMETDGVLYYYVNGRTASKGLYECDGAYYFSDWGGVLKTDGKYLVSTSYCDLPAGSYTFGADGKMLDGIVEIDGVQYLYVNGVLAANGLYKIDGDYYFASADGVLKTNGRYYVSISYCDLPAGNYTFGADGKMLDGIVEIDGVLYLYINGVSVTKGLYEIDGNYYFSDWGGVLNTDGRYYVSTSFCDLPAGNYTFGADGKMYNGVVEIDSVLYLYANGVTVTKGLYKVGDDYYFSNWGGVLNTDGRYYVSTSFCDLPAGNYTFGADGKMYNGVVEMNGVLYLYVNGVTATKGLYQVGDAYYFSNWGGVLNTDGRYYVSTSFCDLPSGNYTFGADGKMYNGVVEMDGVLYLYVNGVTVTKGLYKVGDEYYFSDWGGVLHVDGTYYVSTSFCDLPAGNYTFGADGAMFNGFVTIDGTKYYYKNGTTPAPGIIQVDGDYYFVNWGGVVVTNQRYYVFEGNGYTIEMNYTFDQDGKIVG